MGQGEPPEDLVDGELGLLRLAPEGVDEGVLVLGQALVHEGQVVFIALTSVVAVAGAAAVTAAAAEAVGLVVVDVESVEGNFCKKSTNFYEPREIIFCGVVRSPMVKGLKRIRRTSAV